ncbi:hypothetical protein QJS04_geneDACA016594 [Acorus gramineus]|uniref:Uncharacterized protein n=1 Tax=Acorus gramineus TaxID=55184 RepID=A0AAV9BRM8_ACOGR|nr:hypothetical protein QJS04_geneDACA016594 [Acorus gramineus]
MFFFMLCAILGESRLTYFHMVDCYSYKMTAAKIIGGLAASCAAAYAFDVLISDKKLFGGSTPRTITNKEWWEATDKKFQAWPRTAGPPVVMNPISRQNFIVKSSES